MQSNDSAHILPRYQTTKSYEWNFQNSPDPIITSPDKLPGDWKFCGLPVASPLGIPAGPLLNGRWLLYYASLGFDILTYKTVRRVSHPCYELPNLQPVALTHQLTAPTEGIRATDKMAGSWAVSFGMPSKPPKYWQADIEQTRNQLPDGKLLSVSVVATVGDNTSLDAMADDYAQCARWAVDAGAHAIETNFSCPNVATCDGQLFQQPDAVSVVAARVRDAIGDTPYIIKIGRVEQAEEAERLLDAVTGKVDALATTNSIAATIVDAAGQPLFDGAQRGICGAATREASTQQVALFVKIAAARNIPVKLIGVGGASTAQHVTNYLQAGAESIHLATAAMVDPSVGLTIRSELAANPTSLLATITNQ